MRQTFSLFLLIIPCFSFAQPSSASWLRGNWSGIGYQIDGQEWTVRLSAGEELLTISYPSLACGGEWDLREVSDHSATGLETILEGIGNCNQHVEVELELIGPDRLLVHYYLRWYDADKPIAFAVLARVGEVM